MNTLSPFNHVASVLKSLVDSGMTLGILTSNSKENVVSWLNHQKISELFTFVYAESPLFGKKNLLKRVIKKNKMPREKTYYIGDEVRDIEAAKKCGIYSVAVTWGFNSAKILSEHHPDFLIDHPQELLQIK
jgi:phosphoglycolate phosphatase